MAAPVLIVPKPDGTGTLCVDFRRINAVREQNPFSMPRIDSLGGARFMPKLDMTKAYFSSPNSTPRQIIDRIYDKSRSFSVALHGLWSP